MKPGNREERGGVVHRMTAMIDQAIGIIRWVAQPSLAQLMLRLALAVPFWKSGILKWSGFLQLSDTAIYLFTEEFKLHLPGGPYDLPAPAIMAFLSGSGEIIFPVLLVLGLGTRIRRVRSPVHDLHRRGYGAGRLAGPSHMGGHGARHHGLGSRSTVDRSCARSVERVAHQRGGKRLTPSPSNLPLS